MEENQVKTEEVKVEVVETKKKWFTKKRVLTGLGIVAGVTLGALALMKGKKTEEEHNSEGQTILNALYESVPKSDNSEVEE